MKPSFLLIAVTLILSCKKNNTVTDSDDLCLPIKKENIIGRYKLTTLEEKQNNGTIRDYLAEMQPCSQDDIYNFDINGILYIEAGASMCSGNPNSIVKQGTYTIEYLTNQQYFITIRWSASSLNDWGPITCVNSKTITCFDEWINTSGTRLYYKRIWTKL